jgi:hypothetical protein
MSAANFEAINKLTKWPPGSGGAKKKAAKKGAKKGKKKKK